MRTPTELVFRARQESANLLLWAAPPPARDFGAYRPITGLPAPEPVVAYLRGGAFSAALETLANDLLSHRFQMLGSTLSTGPTIEWRRDYKNGITSGTKYFRALPYLDARRVGDHKWIWELNRHQHLVVLAQAYRLGGGQNFLTEIESQIDSWLDDNPFMCGINWCSALEVAFRALSWIWVYHLVGDRFESPFRNRLLNGLDRHGRYLEHNLSVYFSPNTHLLGEAVALEALGTLLPWLPQASRWKDIGAGMVARQMMTQVREDGSHFEQSSYYQVYALDMFLFHHVLSGSNGVFRSKLVKMAEYLSALMGARRTLPFIGDDDGGRFFHPYGPRDEFGRATLATSSVLLNGSWPYEEEDLAPQALWWLGTPALRADSVNSPAAQKSQLFRDAGTAVMISDRTQVLIDCGPLGAGGAGHSHSDSLSMIVRNGSGDVLLDPGTYTYVGDVDQRNWFRGSAAHSTVRIDNRDQAVPAGPFRWKEKPDVEGLQWVTSEGHDLAYAVCRYHADAGAAPLTHRRAVLLLKAVKQHQIPYDCLIVCDVVDGPPGSHLVEQYWHPGERTTSIAPNHVQIGANSHLMFPGGSRFDTVDAWRSATFGEKTPSRLVVVRSQTELPVTLWAALALGDGTGAGFETGSEGDTVLRLGGKTIVLRSDLALGLTFLFSESPS